MTFEVKTEPVDPDYETSTNTAPVSSPATMPIITLPPPRQRPQLKDVLPRLKQMQQMNASAPANVIDELVKKNEFLLAKNNTGDYKPYSRKSRNIGDMKRPENLMEANPQTFLVSPTSQARISAVKREMGPKSKMARYGKILRPRSPTRKCSIPEKDKSHFNYALIESSVKDKSSDKIFKVQKHEMVCAVTCKAMFMTRGGAIKGDFDLQFYWCNFCTFHTTNKAQLVQHGMEHRFHCKFCRYQSFSRADIIFHSAKEHADDFRETANSMKYCILLSDYLQIYSQDTDEDRKKRAAPDDDEDDDDSPPQKAAKLEGRSVDSLSAEELKTLQNDYQIFDMDVETIADKNAVAEEPSPLASASMDIPSDRQIIANSGLATYESPSAISNMGIAESCIQSAMLQNALPSSRSPPTPVSLVATNVSRLAAPAGQFLIQNVANSSVRPAAGSAISPIQSHRLKETRPPPPPPANKPKPGQSTSVSSSLYWSCGYCSFTSHSQSEIKEHSQKSHRGKPHRYVALIMPSDKQSQNGQNADGAKGTSEGTISSKEIEIDNAEDLSDSVPTERESESFKCFHCNFLVRKPELIKGHLFAKHPSLSMVGVDTHSKRLKNIFYCPREDCPFQSKNPALYQSHVERCTPWQAKDLNVAVEKHLVECLENTVKFSKAVQLKEQVSTNLGELSCIYCIFKSRLPSRVKHHVMTKHPLEQMVVWTQSNSKGHHCLIHFCSLCSWHTRIKSRRKKHMLAVHSIENHDIREGNIQIHTDDPFKKLTSALSKNSDNTENISSPFQKENEEPDMLTSVQDSVNSSWLLEEGSDYCYTDHTNDTIYRCLFCFVKCTGLSAIKSHLQKTHPSQKMQAVNVEKCNKEEICVFFLCPEEICSHLYAKESLLIRHAQTHKSLCVSPTELDSNDKTDSYAVVVKSEQSIPKSFSVPQTSQDIKIKCSKLTTKSLFSEQSHTNTDNSSLVYSQGLKEYTHSATPNVATRLKLTSHACSDSPEHFVKNSQHIHSFSTAQSTSSIPISIGSKQNVPNMSLGMSNTQNTMSTQHSLGNSQQIQPVPLFVSSMQNLPTVCHGTDNTSTTHTTQLGLSNTQQIPTVNVTSGSTQNIASVLAARLNAPLLATPSTSNLMLPLVQSLPSVLPCPGGIRLTLMRTPTPTRCIYPNTMTNSPLAVNISNLNATNPLVVPSGIVASVAPTQLATSISLPNVGGLRPGISSGMLLTVIPPASNIPPLDNTVHVEIVRLSEDGHVTEKLACSPLPNYCQPMEHKTETSNHTNISQSGSEESVQKLKIESVDSLAYSLDSGKEERPIDSDKPTNNASATKISCSSTNSTLEGAEIVTSSESKAPESKMLGKTIIVKNNEEQVEPSDTNSNQSDITQKRPALKRKTRKKGSKARHVAKKVVRDCHHDLKETQSSHEITLVDEMNPSCSIRDKKGSVRKCAHNIEKQIKIANLEKFTCKFCESSIHFGVLAIKAHITDNHPDEKFETYSSSEKGNTCYLCPSDSCTFYFPEESVLITHWMSSHEGEDEVTEEPSESTEQNFKETPKKNKGPKSKKGYECLYCADSYVEYNLKSMKGHYEEQHTGQDMIMRDLQVGTLRNSRIVVCSHQDCCYTREDANDVRFKYHQLAHNNSRIFECSICKWFSHDNCAATEHLLTHTKKRKPGFLMEFSLKLKPDGSISKTAIK